MNSASVIVFISSYFSVQVLLFLNFFYPPVLVFLFLLQPKGMFWRYLDMFRLQRSLPQRLAVTCWPCQLMLGVAIKTLLFSEYCSNLKIKPYSSYFCKSFDYNTVVILSCSCILFSNKKTIGTVLCCCVLVSLLCPVPCVWGTWFVVQGVFTATQCFIHVKLWHMWPLKYIVSIRRRTV